MLLRARNPDPTRRGSAVIPSLVVVVLLGSIASATLALGLARHHEGESRRAQDRALSAAESGVSEAIVAVVQAIDQGEDVPAALGSPQAPLGTVGDRYWIGITADVEERFYTLTSQGRYMNATRAIQVVMERQGGGVYANALFAGNDSGDPAYVMPFGGVGGQADEVTGDVYSGGVVELTGDSAVNGTIRALQGIVGGNGEVGEAQSSPDIPGMEYDINHDYDVAALFSGAKYRSDALGGKAWQVAQSNPAHIFRRNPSDRKSQTNLTAKDDYFLEDPYEKVHVDRNQNGKDATKITLSGAPGKPGVNGSDKVYYIDGNLWLHNKKTYSFKIKASGHSRVTFVVKGNIYFSDNLFYFNKNKEGTAFVAIRDEAVPDSGNIYFGDPVFGTLKEMNAFMYAEADFHDFNLDASGSAKVRVNGNMTAGNQVLIERDYVDKYGNVQHSKLTVDFDDRIATGALVLPGLPQSTGQTGGLSLASWREVPPDA